MSRYDREYEDYLEEQYLNQNIDKEDEKIDIEDIINRYFNKETLKEYTNKDNKEYLEFLFQKHVLDNKDKDSQKNEKKINYLDLLKNTYFQKQTSTKDKINYFLLYLKNKYSVISGEVLYTVFNNVKNKEENYMTSSDYKNFILMNFNKETIDLNNEEEQKLFSDILFELFD